MSRAALLAPLALPLLLALAACGGGDTTDNASAASSSGSGGRGGGASSDASSSSASGSGGSAVSASVSAGTGGDMGVSTSASAGTGGGVVAACSGLTLGPGDSDGAVLSGGVMRTYHVHAPPGYSPTKPTMLLFVFHGLFENAIDIETDSEMDPKSDAHNFLVVYPQGLGQSFNAGTCCGTAQGQGVDDVQFVRDLLDKLEGEYCVDAKRVFAAGYSNGGMLSHRLGCELADRIAAIGPVAGTLQISPCVPSRPVPVIDFHGTGDFVVVYGGGGFGNNLSVKDTIAAWVKNDSCTDAMPAGVYQMGDTTCVEYSACKAGAAVRLCTIDQGGHQWPGGKSIGAIGGKLSTDIDASEEMVKFFDAHPMP